MLVHLDNISSIALPFRRAAQWDEKWFNVNKRVLHARVEMTLVDRGGRAVISHRFIRNCGVARPLVEFVSLAQSKR